MGILSRMIELEYSGINTYAYHVLSTGQVYRLRNPSAKYMASLSTYDSSNPTKHWDFPQLSPNRKITQLSKSSESSASVSDDIPVEKDLSALPSQPSVSKVCSLMLKSNK